MTKLSTNNLRTGATFLLITLAATTFLGSIAAQQREEPRSLTAAGGNRILLYVGNVPVYRAKFNAKRAMVAEQQKALLYQVEPSAEDLDTAALSLVVVEQVLLNEAKAQNIHFSDAEVTQRIRSMQDAVEASDNGDAKSAFHGAVAQFGLRDSDFASDPLVISAYREAFTLGEIRTRIAAVRSAESVIATPESRIEKFVQRSHTKIGAIDPSIVTIAARVRERLQLE